MTERSWALWGRAFRPFFLGAGAYAALVVPLWVAMWLGFLAPPTWLDPPGWHGHELLFGFIAAAIAGFLLTAAPVWSGGPVLCGRPLAALLALWVAGRAAMLAAGSLPPALVAAVDGAFLPAVALAATRSLWGSGQHRNYGVVALIAVLAAANLTMHAQALGVSSANAKGALRFGIDAIVVLVLVIGGRITPAFTANTFRKAGRDVALSSPAWLNTVTVGAALASALAGAVLARGSVTGSLALIAGTATLVRLGGWRSWHTRSDPLLWSLHAGIAWLGVGLLAVGAADLGAPVPAATGLHAMTAGGMGSMILAVMTRVGLGHTGRPLVLPRTATAAYVLVHVAAAVRVAAPLAGPAQRWLLAISAGAWAAAFALFVVLYAPLLTAPRPEGKPG
jgi:uncharacterized protein involved in response to NO